MDWQEIISLVIVALSLVLVIRRQILANRNKKSCSNCEIAEVKNNIQYTPK